MDVIHIVVAFLLRDAVLLIPAVVLVQGIIVLGLYSVVLRTHVIVSVLHCSAAVVPQPVGVLSDVLPVNKSRF